jgi:2-oxo-3-hexenedioate decarboxylase
MIDLHAIAARLDAAALTAKTTHQSPADAELSLAQAYAVQEAMIHLRLVRGERIVGLKMGFTSRAKMVQMGIDEMIFGRLTSGMQVEEGGTTPFDRYVHPRVEPEVAFLLGRDLCGTVTHLEARAAVEAIAPALEIIDSRYENFKFSLADVVADNASSSGFVIGAAHSPDLDLANLGMALYVNGVAREIGSSAAILGNPWRSLIVAARFAETYGFTLRRGDVVMAGGATAAVALTAGAHVALETQSLATVSFGMAG